MRTSTAYDLSAFAPAPQTQKPVRLARPAKSNREKRRFLSKMAGYLFAIVLLMTATVMSRMQLTEIKADINSSNSELTELQSENAYLNYKLESLVSLKNAENYAINELGLVKMDSSRIEYVNLQDENQIITETGETLGEKFDAFVNAVIEFFGG